MIYVLMCKNVQGVNFWKYRQIPFLLSDVCFLNSNFFAGKLFLQTSKYLEKKSQPEMKTRNSLCTVSPTADVLLNVKL